MHVTAIDHVTLRGQLTEITLCWQGEPHLTDLPVCFNQGNHLRAQREGTGAWLAGTVTLPDAYPDAARLAAAVVALLRQHDALRARFEVSEPPRQHVFDATQISARPRVVGRVWHGFLTALLNERCRAGEVPGIFFGLLDRTLICAFDHAHADALTIDLVLRQLLELYRDPAALLPASASFATRCEVEAAGGTVTMGPGVDRASTMDIWRRFFAATGNTLPAFPIALGPTALGPTALADGPAPTRTVVAPVLASHDADVALPSRAFAHILACLAGAVADAGGPATLATLIPVHTRGPRDSGWHHTAGWMVSNAPVIVDADDAASAQAWLQHAPAVAELALPDVLAEIQPSFVTAGVFMVSYLDYRKFGPALPDSQHISATAHTDTAQLWFTRSEHGLDVRVRYPALPVADAVIAAVLSGLTARLQPRIPAVSSQSA